MKGVGATRGATRCATLARAGGFCFTPAAGGTAVNFYELRQNLRRWRALRAWWAPPCGRARTLRGLRWPTMAVRLGAEGRWFKSSRPRSGIGRARRSAEPRKPHRQAAATGACGTVRGRNVMHIVMHTLRVHHTLPVGGSRTFAARHRAVGLPRRRVLRRDRVTPLRPARHDSTGRRSTGSTPAVGGLEHALGLIAGLYPDDAERWASMEQLVARVPCWPIRPRV
jgi:hypothetical protein